MCVTKICKMCGKEFQGKTRACYCSPRCRLDYQADYAKRYREANREKVRKYNRDYQKIYWRRTHSEQIPQPEN